MQATEKKREIGTAMRILRNVADISTFALLHVWSLLCLRILQA
jgi:hypothetical protein